MPAKIKLSELDALRFLASRNFIEYLRLEARLLHEHGCSLKTHYINEQGWITERVKKE